MVNKIENLAQELENNGWQVGAQLLRDTGDSLLKSKLIPASLGERDTLPESENPYLQELGGISKRRENPVLTPELAEELRSKYLGSLPDDFPIRNLTSVPDYPLEWKEVLRQLTKGQTMAVGNVIGLVDGSSIGEVRSTSVGDILLGTLSQGYLRGIGKMRVLFLKASTYPLKTS
ncbi:MAG: hypothetical protein Q7R49_01360 [Candidatus Daviesbacteria bacterium]|nr:hypothetical protein [Candidatus Daviesbacteria bacterium]